MWAAYRGSRALAIGSQNSLFMFNPGGCGRAQQIREEGGCISTMASLLKPVRCTWGASSACGRVLCTPARSHPSSFFSSVFACQHVFIQQPAIPSQSLHTHRNTHVCREERIIRPQTSSSDSWASHRISCLIDCVAGKYWVYGVAADIWNPLWLQQSICHNISFCLDSRKA